MFVASVAAMPDFATRASNTGKTSSQRGGRAIVCGKTNGFIIEILAIYDWGSTTDSIRLRNRCPPLISRES